MMMEVYSEGHGEVINYWPGLIRVTSVRDIDDPEKGVVRVKAPGWDRNVSIPLPVSRFSRDILEKIKPGTRMLAFMDLSADRAADLGLSNFRVLPEQDLPKSMPAWTADL